MISLFPSECTSTRGAFSAYLDGAVSGRKMQAIASHLDRCPSCNDEFAGLRAMQRSLSALGPAKVPADLGMKLRIAISHERADQSFRLVDRLSLQWENLLRPMMFQVSAGLAGSIVLVGGIMLLLGMVAAPEPVMANDEPLGALTQPHYLYSATTPGPILTAQDTTIVVEALINAEGRVYDYNVVSGPNDPAVTAQINNQLLLSVFQPAEVFDSPVRGRVILTFSGISVRG